MHWVGEQMQKGTHRFHPRPQAGRNGRRRHGFVLGEQACERHSRTRGRGGIAGACRTCDGGIWWLRLFCHGARRRGEETNGEEVGRRGIDTARGRAREKSLEVILKGVEGAGGDEDGREGSERLRGKEEGGSGGLSQVLFRRSCGLWVRNILVGDRV